MWRIYSLTSGKWHISSLAARGSMHDALETWQRRVVLCIDIATYIGRRCMAGDEECIVERLLRLWKKKKGSAVVRDAILVQTSASHLLPLSPISHPQPLLRSPLPPPPLAPLSSCPHCFDPRPLPPPPEHFFPRHETRRIPLLGKKTPFSRISARRYPRRAARCFSMSPIVPPAPNSQLASSAGKES